MTTWVGMFVPDRPLSSEMLSSSLFIELPGWGEDEVAAEENGTSPLSAAACNEGISPLIAVGADADSCPLDIWLLWPLAS